MNLKLKKTNKILNMTYSGFRGSQKEKIQKIMQNQIIFR